MRKSLERFENLCETVLFIDWRNKYELWLRYLGSYIHMVCCSGCPPFIFIVCLVGKSIFFYTLLKFQYLQLQSVVQSFLSYEIKLLYELKRNNFSHKPHTKESEVVKFGELASHAIRTPLSNPTMRKFCIQILSHINNPMCRIFNWLKKLEIQEALISSP